METALLLTPPLPLTLSLHGLWSPVLFEPWGGWLQGSHLWLSTLQSLTLSTLTRCGGSAVFPDTPKVASLSKVVALIYDYKRYYLEGELTGITYTFRKTLSMYSPLGGLFPPEPQDFEQAYSTSYRFLAEEESLKPNQRIVDYLHYWLFAATSVGTSCWAGQQSGPQGLHLHRIFDK